MAAARAHLVAAGQPAGSVRHSAAAAAAAAATRRRRELGRGDRPCAGAWGHGA